MKKRWIYLFIGMLAMLSAGVLYTWSILKAPLSETFAWSERKMAFNFTLTMCMFCLGGLIVGIAQRQFSLKHILAVSAILSGAGFLISSRLTGNILMLYLFYGIMSGLGIGITYNGILTILNAWFPDKTGLCNGLLMMSFGASSLVFGSVAQKMFATSDNGWRIAYQIIGCIITVVLLLFAILVQIPTSMSISRDQNLITKIIQDPNTQTDIAPKEMTRLSQFWWFYFFTICMASVGNVVISFARDISVFMGASVQAATLLVGILSICNALGRITSGILVDRLGIKKTMLFGNVITTSASALLLVATALHSFSVFFAGLVLVGISYGFSPSITSSFIIQQYGPAHYSSNFSIVNTFLIPTAMMAAVAGSMVTITGKYTYPLILLLVLSFLSVYCNIRIFHKRQNI